MRNSNFFWQCNLILCLFLFSKACSSESINGSDVQPEISIDATQLWNGTSQNNSVLLEGEFSGKENTTDAFEGLAESSCSTDLRLKTVYRNHTTGGLGIAVDSDCSGADDAVNFRLLETTEEDRFFLGLALEPAENRMYWSTRKELVAADLDASLDSQTTLMDGWIKVTFLGYNLGQSLDDIEDIRVQDIFCGSLEYSSPNKISCTSGHPTIVAWNGTDDDVSITTKSGGTGAGSSLIAEIRVKEGMKRPYITKISVSSLSFNPHATAVSTKLGRLFYSDILLNKIGYCDSADGHNPAILLSNVGPVHGMAVDEDANMLYYTDSNSGKVFRLNLISEEQETILSNLQEPRGISLDPLQNMMYLTVSGYQIVRAHMDGSNMNLNLAAEPFYMKQIHKSKSTARFDGIGIVPSSSSTSSFLPYERTLYWCDGSESVIYWSSMYGTHFEEFVSPKSNDINLLWPMALAIDSFHQKIYVTEFLGKIHRYSLNDSDASEILYETSYYTSNILRYESLKSRKGGVYSYFHLSAD